MDFTLTWGDFLALAVAVLALVRSSRFFFDGATPNDVRAKRQLDAIMKHLGLPEPAVSRPGSLSPQVLALVVA